MSENQNKPMQSDWIVVTAAVLGFNADKSVKVKFSSGEEWLGLSVIHPDDLPGLKKVMKWEPTEFRIPRWLAERLQLIGG